MTPTSNVAFDVRDLVLRGLANQLDACERRRLAAICQTFELDLLSLLTLSACDQAAGATELWALEPGDAVDGALRLQATNAAGESLHLLVARHDAERDRLTVLDGPEGLVPICLFSTVASPSSLDSSREFTFELPAAVLDMLRRANDLSTPAGAPAHDETATYGLAAGDQERLLSTTAMLADMGVVIHSQECATGVRLEVDVLGKQELAGVCAVRGRCLDQQRMPIELAVGKASVPWPPLQQILELTPLSETRIGQELQRVIAGLADPTPVHGRFSWLLPPKMPRVRYLGLGIQPVQPQELLAGSASAGPRLCEQVSPREHYLERRKHCLATGARLNATDYGFLVTKRNLDRRVGELEARIAAGNCAAKTGPDAASAALRNLTMHLYTGADDALLEKTLGEDADGALGGAHGNAQKQEGEDRYTRLGLADNGRSACSLEAHHKPSTNDERARAAREELERIRTQLREQIKCAKTVRYCELVWFENWSRTEAAAHLGLNKNTARNALWRFLDWLRNQNELSENA